MKGFWDKEPVIITLFGSAAFWPALFALLSAFGHPLTSDQQTAMAAFGTLLAGFIIRQQVIPTSGATLPQGTKITTPAVPAQTAVVSDGNPAPFGAPTTVTPVVATTGVQPPAQVVDTTLMSEAPRTITIKETK
jgi:hypothetical protein